MAKRPAHPAWRAIKKIVKTLTLKRQRKRWHKQRVIQRALRNVQALAVLGQRH